MFQQGALFDSLSVGENVAFPLQEAGLKNEEELDSRISAALESSDSQDRKKKCPRTFPEA